jgi:hypothetical protein
MTTDHPAGTLAPTLDGLRISHRRLRDPFSTAYPDICATCRQDWPCDADHLLRLLAHEREEREKEWPTSADFARLREAYLGALREQDALKEQVARLERELAEAKGVT